MYPLVNVRLALLASGKAAQLGVLGKPLEVFLAGREVSYLLVLLKLLRFSLTFGKPATRRSISPGRMFSLALVDLGSSPRLGNGS